MLFQKTLQMFVYKPLTILLSGGLREDLSNRMADPCGSTDLVWVEELPHSPTANPPPPTMVEPRHQLNFLNILV